MCPATTDSIIIPLAISRLLSLLLLTDGVCNNSGVRLCMSYKKWINQCEKFNILHWKRKTTYHLWAKPSRQKIYKHKNRLCITNLGTRGLRRTQHMQATARDSKLTRSAGSIAVYAWLRLWMAMPFSSQIFRVQLQMPIPVECRPQVRHQVIAQQGGCDTITPAGQDTQARFWYSIQTWGRVTNRDWLSGLYVTLPCVVFSFRHCRTGPSSRRFSSFNPSMSASAEMMQNRECSSLISTTLTFYWLWMSLSFT